MIELKKIVWAVDILGEGEPPNQALAFLRALTSKIPCQVDPVYLLQTIVPRVPAAQRPLWTESFRTLAAKKLLELTHSSELPQVTTGTILLETDNSIRQATLHLIRYAQDKSADAILVTTHARKGVNRLFLGSFTETLLLQSTIPVITVNPGTRLSQRISKILFPTAFGQASRRGFEDMVSFAQRLEAQLVLFYKEPPIPMPSFVSGPALYYEYSEEEAISRRKIAQAWVDWAKNRGCQIELVLNGHPGGISAAITDFAAAQAIDLISMVSLTGPVSSILLGSVARQVIRTAPCPVWVRHP